MRELKCLRCGTMMEFLGVNEVAMENLDFITGDRTNIIGGTLEFELYKCPECGKGEIYNPKHIVYRKKELQEVAVEKAKWRTKR